MKITFDDQTLDLTPSGNGFIAELGDKTVEVKVLRTENGRLDMMIDHNRVVVFVSSAGAQHWVTVHGQTFVLTKSSGGRRGGPRDEHASAFTAPMPGQVGAVNVKAGDPITKGQTLLVVEAMKMEIRIQAPRNGKVRAVHVKQGQTVDREQILIETVGEDE
jgi:biotin carboxyl carrier protein